MYSKRRTFLSKILNPLFLPLETFPTKIEYLLKKALRKFRRSIDLGFTTYMQILRGRQTPKTVLLKSRKKNLIKVERKKNSLIHSVVRAISCHASVSFL